MKDVKHIMYRTSINKRLRQRKVIIIILFIVHKWKYFFGFTGWLKQ